MLVDINDKFILHSENGKDYTIKVVNINTYRPPEQKYVVDVWDDQGQYAGDVKFVSDMFFLLNREKLEKVK